MGMGHAKSALVHIGTGSDYSPRLFGVSNVLSVLIECDVKAVPVSVQNGRVRLFETIE